MDLLLRIVLVAVACALAGAVGVLVFKFKGVHARRDVELNKEEVLGRLFLRKMKTLGEAHDGEPKHALKKLNGLMRAFFSELFDISYEFDYLELNEELGKKGVPEDIRKDVIDYSMKVEELEYGGRQVTEDELASLVEKSVYIIRSVSERRPAPEELPEEVAQAAGEPVAPKEEKKTGTLSAKIDSMLRKPFERHAAGKEPEPAPPAAPGPEEAVPKPRKKEPAQEENIPEETEESMSEVVRPAGGEGAAEEEKEPEKAQFPGKNGEKIAMIRKLLVLSENGMASGNHDDAMESYGQLREAYDSLPPEEKRKMYPETKRIIALYNSLLKEYKSILTTGE